MSCMEKKQEKRFNGFRKSAVVLSAVCFLLAEGLWVVTEWYAASFDTSLAGLLFTLTIPQKGTGTSAWLEPAKLLAPRILKIFGAYLLLLYLTTGRRVAGWVQKLRRKAERAEDQNASPAQPLFRKGQRWLGRAVLLVGVLCLVISPAHTFFRLHGPDYFRRLREQTHIYEQAYVGPDTVRLTPAAEKPNLISLYLESMETTYASTEDGGRQTVNYMPQLTALARENLSFSNTDRLGGLHSTDNTNWTMAALFAGTSGLPFAFPVEQNSMYKYQSFAPEIVTLGDLLSREGYTQEFLCGSDGEYGGRALYFRSHGDYAIYDLWEARRQGDIPEDYYVWWGFEDEKLFRIAQKELIRLWEKGEPFNLTILTVDAHHLGGYVCGLCGEAYEDKTANVIACTDRQVSDFVAWCREQPFWDSTVMVINGDHPRMDTCLTEDVAFLDRTIYNCFLNARKTPARSTAYREATIMDLFPTTLSAMGWEIEGGRLGLGTDLFSDEATLAEQMGIEQLNEETSRYSSYFVKHFAK